MQKGGDTAQCVGCPQSGVGGEGGKDELVTAREEYMRGYIHMTRAWTGETDAALRELGPVRIVTKRVERRLNGAHSARNIHEARS